MAPTYHYPYEVARTRDGAKAYLKRSAAAVALRESGVDLLCCECNAAWGSVCKCPETEAEHVERMEEYLSRHPSVMRYRQQCAAHVAAGGNPRSLTDFSRWLSEQHAAA